MRNVGRAWSRAVDRRGRTVARYMGKEGSVGVAAEAGSAGS